MSSNVKLFGYVVSAESCVSDPQRKLIVYTNRDEGQKEVPSDGWVSLLNPDGSEHTFLWIGVNRNGLTFFRQRHPER